MYDYTNWHIVLNSILNFVAKQKQHDVLCNMRAFDFLVKTKQKQQKQHGVFGNKRL